VVETRRIVVSKLLSELLVSTESRHRSRLIPTRRVVRPALHNKNLLTFLNGREIALAARHSKVRRAGYSQEPPSARGVPRETKDPLASHSFGATSGFQEPEEASKRRRPRSHGGRDLTDGGYANCGLHIQE
jgi:hypothetical protein